MAEEVTQDIFLNIWLKASTYNGHRGEARSWVMSITHHRAVDVLRSRQRALSKIEPMDAALLESLPSKGTPVDEEVERNLDRERLLKALSTLPLAQQEVILMAYFQGYSQSEIAEKLQQPLGTVKTRVRLAMQKLREALKENVQ